MRSCMNTKYYVTSMTHKWLQYPKKKAILNQEKQGVCYMQMKRALITFKEVQYKNAVVFYICGSMLKANGNAISKNIILKL